MLGISPAHFVAKCGHSQVFFTNIRPVLCGVVSVILYVPFFILV